MISADDFRAAASIKVLIIEDEADAGAALVESLEQSGTQTAWAKTGAQGLQLNRSFCPDVVLVDLGLPDIDGISLVKMLAVQGDCGIIIVSGSDDAADRIVGLEVGADDYVIKPPHPRELRARIRAVHRRMALRSVIKTDPVRAVIQLGAFQVDLAGHTVRSENGDRIALTNAEFVALEVMITADGEAVSRDRLSEMALRRPWRPEDRSVDQLVFNLRQKLGSRDGQRLIHSVRGAGYLLTIGSPRGDQDKVPPTTPAQMQGWPTDLPQPISTEIAQVPAMAASPGSTMPAPGSTCLSPPAAADVATA